MTAPPHEDKSFSNEVTPTSIEVNLPIQQQIYHIVFKINFDCAARGNSGLSGIGALFDDKEIVLLHLWVGLTSVKDPNEAEVWAFRQTLKVPEDLFTLNVIVEINLWMNIKWLPV